MVTRRKDFTFYGYIKDKHVTSSRNPISTVIDELVMRPIRRKHTFPQMDESLQADLYLRDDTICIAIARRRFESFHQIFLNRSGIYVGKFGNMSTGKSVFVEKSNDEFIVIDKPNPSSSKYCRNSGKEIDKDMQI